MHLLLIYSQPGFGPARRLRSRYSSASFSGLDSLGFPAFEFAGPCISAASSVIGLATHGRRDSEPTRRRARHCPSGRESRNHYGGAASWGGLAATAIQTDEAPLDACGAFGGACSLALKLGRRLPSGRRERADPFPSSASAPDSPRSTSQAYSIGAVTPPAHGGGYTCDAPQFFDADQVMFLLYNPWPADYVRVN